MSSKGLESIGNKVQVITAGGAGSGGAKPQRRTPTSVSAQSERSVLDEPRATNTLEYKDTEAAEDGEDNIYGLDPLQKRQSPYKDNQLLGDTSLDHHELGASPTSDSQHSPKSHELFWLFVCFLGIMFSFVAYGLLLEYTTSGGRKLHELSFLFVTSGLYTLTAAAGRYVRDETPTTIPPARFAILGLTSMGSTFCSVRSLRCVS